MYKLSINKALFDDILLRKTNLLTKENNKYWKKELLDISIVNDKISYNLKHFDKLTLTNGLGKNKPQIVVECKELRYSNSKNSFEFYLGKVLEQKNTDLEENYKDNLIEQLLREKQELEDSINRDHLTRIYNRKKMQDDLDSFVNQSNSSYLTAIFIDADRFKGINDNFGHEAGDKTLVYLSSKLQKTAKLLNGEVYRYGGEEFLILCFIEKQKLLPTLNVLKEDIKNERIKHKNRDISVSVSMGVSFFSDCNNKQSLLQKADEALYKAKDLGRDRIEFYL